MKKPDVIAFGKAIADPTRQQLMRELCCEWLCVSDLVERMGLTQPTISHHIAILSDAGCSTNGAKGAMCIVRSIRR